MQMDKYSILPAILEPNLDSLFNKLNLFDTVAPKIQIDILDGKLVDNISWPYTDKNPKLKQEFNDCFSVVKSEIQLHLMLADNKYFFDNFHFILEKSSEILVHAESRDAEKAVKFLINKGFKPGLSFMMETDYKDFIYLFDKINFVQFMCIDKIGMQGSSFNPKVIDKIREFHINYPNKRIVVDGGVKMHTLQDLHDAGAMEFAVGSAIFASENPVATYKKMSDFLTLNF